VRKPYRMSEMAGTAFMMAYRSLACGAHRDTQHEQQGL
jgi:hypothetical protein